MGPPPGGHRVLGMAAPRGKVGEQIYLTCIMTTVYRELLPESYLLLLLPGPAHPTGAEPSLAWGLDCASRSGRAAVWVDCELVHDLSPAAVQLLAHYHGRLEEAQQQLLLVHCSEVLIERLQSAVGCPPFSFACTLHEAAWQSGLALEE